jgi:hypothetical protein
VAAVVPLEYALQQFWDANSMKGARDSAEGVPQLDHKPTKVTNDDIDSVSAFVLSKAHWCYLRMLQSTATVVQVAEASEAF